MRHTDSDYLDSDYRRSYRENDRHYHDNYNRDRRIRSRSRGPSHRSDSLDSPPRSQLSRYRSGKEEIYDRDPDSQSVYKVYNNRVYKVPTGASDDDRHNTPLAGLIFMSNDKVRVSSFRYNVLGMPLAKKPIIDRVVPGTKLFLFEHEARVLWGIYEATSTAEIDIEKNIYRGSPVPFPAQVRFRVFRYCRPLPEKVFRPVIEENYFTPTKFNFELSESQVSELLNLFDQREAERLRMNVRDRSSSGRNDFFKSLPATASHDGRTSYRHKEEKNTSAREHNNPELFRTQISNNDNIRTAGYKAYAHGVHKKNDGPKTEGLSLLAASPGSISNSAKPKIGDVRNISIDLNSTIPTEDMECETRYPETDISKGEPTGHVMVDYFNTPKVDADKAVKGGGNLLPREENPYMLEISRWSDRSMPSNSSGHQQTETATSLKLNSYEESEQNPIWATTDQDMEPNTTIGLSLMSYPSEARKTHNFFPVLNSSNTMGPPEESFVSDRIVSDDYNARAINLSSPYKVDDSHLATENIFTRVSNLEENVSCNDGATNYANEDTIVRKDNTDCFINNFSRKRNATDCDVQSVGVRKKQASSSPQVESDEEWLEKARSAVINSVISRSNKSVECSPKGGHATSDSVQRSVSRSLEKRLNIPYVSNSPGRTDQAESGRSVWSRLSAPKNSSLNRHLSFSKPSEYSDDASMTRTRKRNM